MARRIIRRRVVMREYDYNKVVAQATVPSRAFGNAKLYDRAEFIPLDQTGLEKIQVIEILKGKESPFLDPTLNLNEPAALMFKLKDFMYNEGYCHWSVTKDDDGFVCVQAKKNTPKSRIGLAIFEKELGARI